MITSFYTASTGVMQLQKGFDVTANNIANVNTNGYKPSEATFTDLVYSNVREEGNEYNYSVGHGAKLDKTDNLVYKQGSMQQTGRTLDYAITTEDGFFGVLTDDGAKYTRNGNFELTLVDDEFYLTASGGGYVLDSEGEPIVLESVNDEINIGVFTCSNSEGLLREANLLYSETLNSGEMDIKEDASVLSGFLEGSAVDLADEMASMIVNQRAFQLNSKLVQVADEIMETMNNLR